MDGRGNDAVGVAGAGPQEGRLRPEVLAACMAAIHADPDAQQGDVLEGGVDRDPRCLPGAADLTPAARAGRSRRAEPHLVEGAGDLLNGGTGHPERWAVPPGAPAAAA